VPFGDLLRCTLLRCTLLRCTLLAAMLFAAVPVAVAQKEDAPATARAARPGPASVGAQVGRPGGLAVRLYRSDRVAYDAVFTTDLDERVLLSLHRVWEWPLPESSLIAFAGPGLLLGTDAIAQRSQAAAYGSVSAGLHFYAERFDVFLHVTPRLRFLPDVDAQLGGGVGLRYHF
jgi:hypothetical protein